MCNHSALWEGIKSNLAGYKEKRSNDYLVQSTETRNAKVATKRMPQQKMHDQQYKQFHQEGFPFKFFLQCLEMLYCTEDEVKIKARTH